MDIVFNGVQAGIVLAFLIGPVFFTIAQTSLEHGFWKGVQVAVGVSLSDILYVAICYFGFAQVAADSPIKVYMAYGGGVLLLGFGLYYILKGGRPKILVAESPKERHFTRYVIKGFLINGITPMVLFFWIATVSLATLEFGYTSTRDFVLFFAALLITVLLTDVLKAYLAGRLRRIITPGSMRVMNIILGIVLIFFGGRLILAARVLGAS